MRLRNRDGRGPRYHRDARVRRVHMGFEQRHGANAARSLNRSEAFQLDLPGLHRGLLEIFIKIQALHSSPYVRSHRLWRKYQQFWGRNRLQGRFILRLRNSREGRAKNRAKNQSLHAGNPFPASLPHFEHDAGQHPGLIQCSPAVPIARTENGAPTSCGRAPASTRTNRSTCSWTLPLMVDGDSAS